MVEQGGHLRTVGRARGEASTVNEPLDLTPNESRATLNISLFMKRAVTSFLITYPPGQLCVPNVILQEQKGAHDVRRHFGDLLAATENSVHQ